MTLNQRHPPPIPEEDLEILLSPKNEAYNLSFLGSKNQYNHQQQYHVVVMPIG